MKLNKSTSLLEDIAKVGVQDTGCVNPVYADAVRSHFARKEQADEIMAEKEKEAKGIDSEHRVPKDQVKKLQLDEALSESTDDSYEHLTYDEAKQILKIYYRNWKSSDIIDSLFEGEGMWNSDDHLMSLAEYIEETAPDEMFESLSEAKKSEDEGELRSDYQDYEDYDMLVFITNLFTRDLKDHQRPLNPIGRKYKNFEYIGKTFSKSEDDIEGGNDIEINASPFHVDENYNVVLNSDNFEDFEAALEICDKYHFDNTGIVESKLPNAKFKYSMTITVPKLKNGWPMNIEDYFESINIPLDQVMPTWYFKVKKRYNKKFGIQEDYIPREGEPVSKQAENIADYLSQFLNDTSDIPKLEDYLDDYDLEHLTKAMDALNYFAKNFKTGTTKKLSNIDNLIKQYTDDSYDYHEIDPQDILKFPIGTVFTAASDILYALDLNDMWAGATIDEVEEEGFKVKPNGQVIVPVNTRLEFAGEGPSGWPMFTFDDKDSEWDFAGDAIPLHLDPKDIPGYVTEAVANKEPLKEDVILKSVKNFKPWESAVTTLENIKLAGKTDRFDSLINELYPEGITETTLNDLLRFEDDWIYDMLDIDVEALNSEEQE